MIGVGPGDEVITPAMTFFAAPNMIVKVGATPVFVDVEAGTRNIDLAAVEARIGPRTKAIMPTHFAGLPVDMDGLYALAAKHRLRVIEDAALAIGSSWRGQRIGSFGDICIFSFHPNKNITAIEGGALVVNNDHEARTIDVLRFHGITVLPDRTRDVAVAGGKFNLPDVNAAIGSAQLRACPNSTRGAARSWRATSRSGAPIRRACCRIPAIRSICRATAGTCSRLCFRLTNCGSPARNFAPKWKPAASAPACRTKRRTSQRSIGDSAIIRALCPSPNTSPRRP